MRRERRRWLVIAIAPLPILVVLFVGRPDWVDPLRYQGKLKGTVVALRSDRSRGALLIQLETGPVYMMPGAEMGLGREVDVYVYRRLVSQRTVYLLTPLD